MSKYITITGYGIYPDGRSVKMDDILVDKDKAYFKFEDNTRKTDFPVWRDAETGWALFEGAKIIDIDVDGYSGPAYKSQSANGFIYIPVQEKEKLS